MLNLKRKETLRANQVVLKKEPVKIEVDTKVKKEAYIIDSRFNVEKELKGLKKRKIDRMIAGQKMKHQEVNLNLRDPDET
jgi:hypothetical protein